MNIWMNELWIRLDVLLFFNFLTGTAAYLFWRLTIRLWKGIIPGTHGKECGCSGRSKRGPDSPAAWRNHGDSTADPVRVDRKTGGRD